jgi:hypothetical protein
VLPSLGALFDKVEVLDHDSPGTVLLGDGQDLGDGRPKVPVTSGGAKPSKLKGDGDRRPQRVAVTVQGRNGQVPDIEVDRDDRAIAELLESGHGLGVSAPGGVEVPTAIAWSISDVVAHGTIGGLGGDVVAPVRPGDRAAEPVTVVGAVSVPSQSGWELYLQPAFERVPADGLVAPGFVGFPVGGDEPARRLPLRAPLGERLAGSVEVMPGPGPAFTAPAD